MSLWMRTYADWHCRNTQLGTSLRGRFDGGSLHEDIDQSFRDAFRMKASSTLQKRASSMTRLAKLLREAGQLYPLRLSEPELYSALCNMRAAGAGATAAQHIIEALHFVDATAKLLVADLSHDSGGSVALGKTDAYFWNSFTMHSWTAVILHSFLLSLERCSAFEVHFIGIWTW